MKRLIAIIVSLMFAALTLACGGSDTTTTNNGNANSANTSVNKNTNSNANANANANANKGTSYNANISKEDWEKDKESFGQKAKDLGDKVGTGLTDGWLWVKTRGALMAADNLEESGINVDVNNGMITLRGSVPSQDQVKKADAAAKSVSGSKGVQNQLKVSACGGNTNMSMGNKNAPAKK